MSAKIKGGGKLAAHLAKIVANVQKSDGVKVGFFPDATYPDKESTPVAAVAFMDEYGTSTSPARPFFRGTIAEKSGEWGDKLVKAMQITDMDAKKSLDMIGGEMRSDLQQSIQDFTTPKNADSTIAKKGSDHPLIETHLMEKSVKYKVNE